MLGYAYAGAHHSRAAYRWSLDVSAYVHTGERRTERWTHAVYTSLISVLALQGFFNAYAAGTALTEPC